MTIRFHCIQPQRHGTKLIHEADHTIISSDHYFHTCCPSVRTYVRLAQNFKIQRQSLPAGTVGWPSGSLMTPVLFELYWLINNMIEDASNRILANSGLYIMSLTIIVKFDVFTTSLL